ncbi:NAD-dependent epimerase/dehydratase [Sulfurimonas denitrificans DSM 1251]|uniref:NAD-dependent epimerase/dehydratase n=1 Tax=Sulfurimonas denitrificans (strain ATCC 33889 / DSM 1251) TaxID=326298 RepID=Q30PV2_SULDN|nr:GDP-mannose 4,6-dehydratase [Sulfurimonas denitrificans]ABB44979.1 NAD-dependent epimerase/dehydratase [Sulfurimonas denitrificans DSM 1251]MDD3443575.1 GDP-mannose 4,6-dehydratase [Sulfurimonas denitrificans]
MKKVLITGIDSFTGVHLSSYLEKAKYDVYGTSFFESGAKKYRCDVTCKEQILEVLQKVKPDFFIHLSGISFAAHGSHEEFYRVNTIGTTNILDAFVELEQNPSKIVLASSATVYGNQGLEVLDESLCPLPANHYGASKYAMESLSRGYFDKLSIIITRPFNYTGVGQAEQFLIPKIIKHFKEKKDVIELGNLHVEREFNDVSFTCEVYKKLLECDAKGEVVNIASNRGIKLLHVIEMMSEIAGYKIEVKINPAFVRKDEIKSLTGSSSKLFALIGEVEQKEFKQTLRKMLEI